MKVWVDQCDSGLVRCWERGVDGEIVVMVDRDAFFLYVGLKHSIHPPNVSLSFISEKHPLSSSSWSWGPPCPILCVPSWPLPLNFTYPYPAHSFSLLCPAQCLENGLQAGAQGQTIQYARPGRDEKLRLLRALRSDLSQSHTGYPTQVWFL